MSKGIMSKSGIFFDGGQFIAYYFTLQNTRRYFVKHGQSNGFREIWKEAKEIEHCDFFVNIQPAHKKTVNGIYVVKP